MKADLGDQIEPAFFPFRAESARATHVRFWRAKRLAFVAEMGSLPDRQEFSSSWGKP